MWYADEWGQVRPQPRHNNNKNISRDLERAKRRHHSIPRDLDSRQLVFVISQSRDTEFVTINEGYVSVSRD